MTINIFVLKGDSNGKIVEVRFFFCRVYMYLPTDAHTRVYSDSDLPTCTSLYCRPDERLKKTLNLAPREEACL